MTAAAKVAPQAREALLSGRRLAWIEAGDGPSVLLLLHGIGSSAQSWGPLLPHLSPRARCIAWDMPGYGGSDPLEGAAPGAAEYARVLEALLDLLAIERAVVLGHSLGAVPAVELAARRPEAVAGLVLADPAAGYGVADPARWPEGVTARVRDLEREGADAFAAARAARLCAEGAAPEAVEAVRREMARVRLPGYAQAAALLAAGDIARRLPGLGCPLTIVVGAEDRVTPPVRVRPLADLRPGTGYVELPGVGHAGYVEDPAAYAAPVIRMIEQVR